MAWFVVDDKKNSSFYLIEKDIDDSLFCNEKYLIKFENLQEMESYVDGMKEAIEDYKAYVECRALYGERFLNGK